MDYQCTSFDWIPGGVLIIITLITPLGSLKTNTVRQLKRIVSNLGSNILNDLHRQPTMLSFLSRFGVTNELLRKLTPRLTNWIVTEITSEVTVSVTDKNPKAA